MEISRITLLTGAGFTHNFGTPLASGLWAELFNHPLVQAQPVLRTLLLADFDFEHVYNEVMTGSYSNEVKSALQTAVVDAYGKLDDIILGHPHVSTTPSRVIMQQWLSDFIHWICSGDRKSFLFTVNQDLLFERFLSLSETPRIPGVQQPREWFTSHFDYKIDDNSRVKVPEQTALDAIKNEHLDGARILYLKLHGSQNWTSSSGEPRMVIGAGKKDQIESEPLLAWYLDLFRTVLHTPNMRLVTIGYSFSDEHINEVISEGIKSSGLRIYVISPSEPSSTNERLLSKPHGAAIWDGLAGYFQEDLFSLLNTSGRRVSTRMEDFWRRLTAN